MSDDIEKMYSLISGLVGSGVAVEFRSWAKVYKQLPDIEEIFDGKTPYEIKIRLIYSDGYDCYFIGVETKEKSVGFLLDGSTGEIIAIK